MSCALLLQSSGEDTYEYSKMEKYHKNGIYKLLL